MRLQVTRALVLALLCVSMLSGSAACHEEAEDAAAPAGQVSVDAQVELRPPVVPALPQGVSMAPAWVQQLEQEDPDLHTYAPVMLQRGERALGSHRNPSHATAHGVS